MTAPGLSSLIERVEKATEGSRELDAEICRVVGISWSSDEDGNFGGYGIMPRRVRFTESLDAALTLARNLDEQRAILESITDNLNALYDLKRCIIFGVTCALKVHLSSQREPTQDRKE